MLAFKRYAISFLESFSLDSEDVRLPPLDCSINIIIITACHPSSLDIIVSRITPGGS
jgi:hypothetical protein